MPRAAAVPGRLCAPILAWALAGALSLPAGLHAASPAPVAGRDGMVVSAHRLATRVGVDVLRRGGNAVDAAVAVGYALAVTYPAAGNLGGGGFMTVQWADGRKAFLDFREKAPASATADMYLDAQGHPRPGASLRGHLAVAVPGSVAGLERAREAWGSRSRAELLAPAIRLARQGFVFDAADAALLRQAADDLARDAPARRVFLPRGRPLDAGERLVQRDLATTLRAVARQGVNGFSRGAVARKLVASNRAGGGRLTLDDLQAYAPRTLAPVECDYRGFHVVSAPPPSSGGIVLCQILQVLAHDDLPAMGFRSAQAVHLQVEAMRQAYADRNQNLGDPDYVRNPVGQLLDPAYADRIRAAIDPQRARPSREVAPGPPSQEGTQTTHYSIIDREGTAVAVTTTLNDAFGARVMAAGTGVLLNDEMDDFTIKVGSPNLYGLVQGAANAIEPGKRPLSSMSPTIVSRGGKVVLVLGSPGGSRIITSVLHTLLNVIDHGMTVQEAVDAPRFHHQWLPDVIQAERHALSPDTRGLLEKLGHEVQEVPPFGQMAAILVGGPALGAAAPGEARYFGAVDPRRGTGLALGYRAKERDVKARRPGNRAP